MPSFQGVLGADPRPPVVYMRAFERDGETFVVGSREKYGQYARNPLKGSDTAVELTFDEYVGELLTTRIGPFLALGNPADYFAPTGAIRTYFKDSDWMEEFERLARQAACIVVETATSSNLRWELQHLRRSNQQTKLFVVNGHHSGLSRYWLVRLRARLLGISQIEWKPFSITLQELGYSVTEDEPEPGSVFGFDSEGPSQLLTTSADMPDEFVDPMVSWLSSRALVGRCIPIACARCG